MSVAAFPVQFFPNESNFTKIMTMNKLQVRILTIGCAQAVIHVKSMPQNLHELFFFFID